MDFTKIRLYHLHKQNLIQKADASEYSRLLVDHIGLHSTDYLTPYLSLWARIKDFEPKSLFDDLNAHCNALRMRAFRGTVFVIHRENLKHILSGSKKFLASIIKQNERFLLKAGLDLSSIKQAVVKLLAHKNMLTGNEIKKQLPDHLIGEYFNYALRFLEFSGILVRTSQCHITDKIIRYGLMDECFPEITAGDVNPDEALKELVQKYIKKFAPISLEDLSWWLSITKTATRQILEVLSKNVISVDFNYQKYYMEQDDHERFQEFRLEQEDPIANFLPYEDHFPKAYSIRNWFLAEEIAPLVRKEGTIFLGQIFPSIWLNGEIIGGWKMSWVDKAKSEMKVEVIEVHKKLNLSQQVYQLIERQRKELENFVNEKLVPLMNK